MKTNSLKTLMVLFLLIASNVCVGLAEIKEVILIKAPYEKIEDEINKNRMPSRPIQCTISDDGIFIQDYDASEIISYDAYDFSGNCLLMTDDSQEFISLVMTGASIEVRLITADYILRGVLY